MPHEISRRDLVKSALLSSALIPALGLIGKASQAADLTPLDASDPTATALGFVIDASKVDASVNPTFKAGQRCAACAQYQGKPTDAMAGCNLFVGHSVPSGGWCKVWVQRSA
jgi:High potential iron-sulfur protein